MFAEHKVSHLFNNSLILSDKSGYANAFYYSATLQ